MHTHTPNVTHLPTRRRDDTALAAGASDTRRSTPACAVPVKPPLPDELPRLVFTHTEPFADAMLAQDRARRQRAATAELARRTQERLQADQLRRNQLNDARYEGYDQGLHEGFVKGRYWALGIGFLIGGTAVALCVKAGVLVGSA